MLMSLHELVQASQQADLDLEEARVKQERADRATLAALTRRPGDLTIGELMAKMSGEDPSSSLNVPKGEKEAGHHEPPKVVASGLFPPPPLGGRR